MRKKFLTGAAVLALLMSAPQVSADDEIVIFGGEFEDEAAPPASKKVEKPAPKKIEAPQPSKPKAEEPKPAEKIQPAQPIEQPAEKISPAQPIEQPAEKISPAQPIEQPTEKISPAQPIEQPTEKISPAQPIEQPAEKISPAQPIEQPTEKISPAQPIEQPTEKISPAQPIEQPEEKIQPPIVEPVPSVEIDIPFEQPTNIHGGEESFNEPIIERKSVRLAPPSYPDAPPQDLKTLQPRFIKLAVDDTYTYYLDKSTVQWKRVPYLANEYMADVWVRMVEREPSRLSDDMASYGAENFRAEVALARDRGYQYAPEDLKVLRSQSYVLEHYYLRPKTKQIQFLCELEVFGRPQNAINERAYDYKNWENLVPGSVESAIYDATIKIIGKSKADSKGHMTFIDMLDEYARIALN